VSTCAGYPYFSNDKFVLSITLNTTATAYSDASFKTALSSALGLGDTNRIYILKSEQVSSGTRAQPVEDLETLHDQSRQALDLSLLLLLMSLVVVVVVVV
jgi:hypothetical protein